MKRRNKKSLKVRKVTIKQLSVDSLDLAGGGGAEGSNPDKGAPNGIRDSARACAF